MDKNATPTIETMALDLLRPLLKLLYARGLSREALERVCDTGYVAAAADELEKGQRQITPESVADASGVGLASVKGLNHVLEERAASPAHPLAGQAPLMAAAERVMSGWYTDSAFTDDEGRPLPCRLEAERFELLVARHGNGHKPAEIADMLLSTGSAALNSAGELEPRGRHVLAAPASEALAHNAFEALVDLARALEVNQRKRLTGTGAFQRTCVNDRMRARTVPLFRGLVRENTQSFLEAIDDWLVQHEAQQKPAVDEPLVRLGVGVYVIVDE